VWSKQKRYSVKTLIVESGMLKKIILLSLFFIPKTLLAQSYEKEFETLFAWQVKQIDEFIERFDDNDSTLIKQYNQKHNGSSTVLTREKLIKSLFNAERTDWNYNELSDFIKQVDNKNNPQYLDFNNGNWFANVNCAIIWNGKPGTILLKLKIQKQTNGGLKWVIADVDAKGLKQPGNVTVAVKGTQPILPMPIDDTSLNPTSHTTDFLNIDEVSMYPQNISNYLVTANNYSADFCLFINECLSNRLKIVRANSVTYSFYQIKGWEIEIQQYNRQTKNSGWLIYKLVKLPS
jgi:hypothetical protein